MRDFVAMNSILSICCKEHQEEVKKDSSEITKCLPDIITAIDKLESPQLRVIVLGLLMFDYALEHKQTTRMITDPMDLYIILDSFITGPIKGLITQVSSAYQNKITKDKIVVRH